MSRASDGFGFRGLRTEGLALCTDWYPFGANLFCFFNDFGFDIISHYFKRLTFVSPPSHHHQWWNRYTAILINPAVHKCCITTPILLYICINGCWSTFLSAYFFFFPMYNCIDCVLGGRKRESYNSVLYLNTTCVKTHGWSARAAAALLMCCSPYSFCVKLNLTDDSRIS